MTTLCFVFGRTQSAPSLFLYGFRKNRDFAGISLGSERFLGEEEQRQQDVLDDAVHTSPIHPVSVVLCLSMSSKEQLFFKITHSAQNYSITL